MALIAYAILKNLELNGVVCHVGRLVELDSDDRATKVLLQSGVIGPRTTEPEVFDYRSGAPHGERHASAFKKYRVTRAGHDRVHHDGRPRAYDEVIELDDHDVDPGIGRDPRDGHSTARRMVDAGLIEPV